MINVENILNLPKFVNLNMKLENMQHTGSFKIRGVINQIAHVDKNAILNRSIVATSGGNYGKALATISKQLQLQCLIVMPNHAPKYRVETIKKLGGNVELVENNMLQKTADYHVQKDNMMFLHPYDDYNLIAGHASCGYEILEQCHNVDIIIVCCGGGGLLAGISSSVKPCLPNCKIYGVEPYGASKMFQSFRMQTPVTLENVDTIATGLAPPYAGKITYDICSRNVDAIILVSDEEIKASMAKCYETGLVVEPSGCAALAALMHGKVPGIDLKAAKENDLPVNRGGDYEEIIEDKTENLWPLSNDYIQYSPFFDASSEPRVQQALYEDGSGVKLNVVVVLTGGNISPNDLAAIVNSQREL
ncbi:unnamed protein product [Gordionus sp. m RMFG-2023]